MSYRYHTSQLPKLRAVADVRYDEAIVVERLDNDEWPLLNSSITCARWSALSQTGRPGIGARSNPANPASAQD
jgi:hypothetical protein